MDKWLSNGFWQPQEMFHWGTCTHDARSNSPLPNQNWCLKIRNRSDPYSIGCKWWQTSNLFHIKDFITGRKKLQDLWQRTFGHHSSAKGMAALHSRISTHDSDLVRSQEPHILLSKETQSSTGEMVSLPLRIRCQIGTYPMKQNGTVWCPITATRPLSWWRHR